MREITEIIIHCTATKEGLDFHVKNVDSWHKAKGMKKQKKSGLYCGYHYLIDLKGVIEQGRFEEEQGAHCVGHNTNSIGIVYVGGLDEDGNCKDTRTIAQKAAMYILLVDLKARYPEAKVYGHNEFANKCCPSFDVQEDYGEFNMEGAHI